MDKNKIQKMRWFSLFCSWGQYFRHKNKKTFFLTNLFAMTVWVVAFGYFNNYFQATSYKTMAFPLSMLLLKAARSVFEKYIYSPVPYTMTKFFPLSEREVLLMRLLVKYSLPSELFGISALFFNFYLPSKNETFSLLSTLVFLFLMMTVEEMSAYLSYNISGLSIPQVLLNLFPFGGVIVLFCVQVTITPKLLMFLFILAIFLTTVLFGLFHWKGWHLYAKRKGERESYSRRSLRVSKGKISSYKMLWLKEYLFLFKHKWSTIFSTAFIAATLSLSAESRNTFFNISAFFIVEFAMSYGMNYLGVEEQDSLLVLNASTPFRILLRVKIMVFQLISFLSALFIFFIYFFFFQVRFVEGVKEVLVLFPMIFVFSVLSHYFSLAYYACDKTKKKRFILRVVVALTLYTVFIVVYALFSEIRTKGWVWFSSFLVISFVSVYFTNYKLHVFEKILYDKKEKILKDLSEY